MTHEQSDEISRAMRRWAELGYAADIDVMEASLRLASVHARAVPLVEATHRGHGLAAGDFDVLATVYRSGSVTPGELAQQLLYSKSGTTGRLDRLEGAGLVLRERRDSDRRGVIVSLSEAGRRLVEELMPAHVSAERALVSTLTRSELATLNRLLAKVMRQLADSEELDRHE